MEASETKNCLSYFRKITPLTRDHGVIRVKAYLGFAAARCECCMNLCCISQPAVHALGVSIRTAFVVILVPLQECRSLRSEIDTKNNKIHPKKFAAAMSRICVVLRFPCECQIGANM
jgi:hypothetical protein